MRMIVLDMLGGYVGLDWARMRECNAQCSLASKSVALDHTNTPLITHVISRPASCLVGVVFDLDQHISSDRHAYSYKIFLQNPCRFLRMASSPLFAFACRGTALYVHANVGFCRIVPRDT